MSSDPHMNGGDPRGDANEPTKVVVDLAQFSWNVQRLRVADPDTHVIEEVVVLDVVPTLNVAIQQQHADAPIGVAQVGVVTVPVGVVVRLRLTKASAEHLGLNLANRPVIQTP